MKTRNTLVHGLLVCESIALVAAQGDHKRSGGPHHKKAKSIGKDTGVVLATQKAKSDDPLTRLGFLYGTDKATLHRYTSYYHALFGPLRATTRNFLEVGVFKGQSVQMWRDYFSTSQIYGIDYFRGKSAGTWARYERVKAKLDAPYGPRVHLFDVNQSSVDEMTRAFANDAPLGKAAPYDIIVEDGSHLQRDQQLSLAQLLPLVAPGGIYIIEDISSSYHHGYDEVPSSAGTTAEILRAFNATGAFRSKHLSEAQAAYIGAWVESAYIVSTYRRRWDLLGVLRKRTTPRRG